MKKKTKKLTVTAGDSLQYAPMTVSAPDTQPVRRSHMRLLCVAAFADTKADVTIRTSSEMAQYLGALLGSGRDVKVEIL